MRLATVHLRPLGALLATFAPAISFAEPQSTSEISQKPDHLASLLSRAKVLPLSTQTTPNTNTITPSEAARAKQLLSRYYSLRDEAIAANMPTKDAPAKKKKIVRTSADKVFRDFEHANVKGAVCVKHVIIGGGTAAWAAVESLLSHSVAPHEILVVCEEDMYPYNRTPLSKELWQGADAPEGTVYEYAMGQNEGKVSVMRGTRGVSVDADTKTVSLSNGVVLQYGRLLLATGGRARSGGEVAGCLSADGVKERSMGYRTVRDYERLRAMVDAGKEVVIIGGGFLGTELATSLAKRGGKVTHVVAEAGVLFGVLPRYLCEFIARKMSEMGISVLRRAFVESATMENERVVLDVGDGRKVAGDIVVTAAGIVPNVELARKAGLEVDQVHGGIMVNEGMLATGDIFAAGDNASFYDRALGRRRIEHWDHAVVTGKIAGANMAGGHERYGLQSMFWCDLSGLDVRMTAVGLVDSRLSSVGVWNVKERAVLDSRHEFREGVVWYVKDGVVVGCMLWNVPKGGLRKARAVVQAGLKVNDIRNVLGEVVGLPNGERVVVERETGGIRTRPT